MVHLIIVGMLLALPQPASHGRVDRSGATSRTTFGLGGGIAICGNGFREGGEGCDDGNTDSGDCCSASCQPEDLGNLTCGVGACERTVAACVNGVARACVPGAPAEEVCNAIDDDCDGETDEDLYTIVGTRWVTCPVALANPE